MKEKNRHKKAFKILGQNIKTLRKNRRISQEELAFMISSARNYIGSIERNEKIPSLNIILDIKEALECDINDLFKNM